ncbi:MAG: phosphatase PAP2 family protein [Firmicutes bacterium]|nr:phosphatase PAP2 family protein [Bacillota bacterium]MTI68682.1 phosphatase PAP2 family protein [Bacillota bacterium]
MKNLFKHFTNGDQKIFYFLNGKLKCRPLDITMPYLTRLGGAVFSILLPLILLLFGKNKTRIIGFEILVSITLSHLFVRVIKNKFSRVRPYDILENINTYNITLKDYSFPSGHTTASFSMATVISLNIPYLMAIIMGLATIIGISRIYVGVHYPSDVMVGIILGSSTSYLVHPYFINIFL